MGINLDLFEKRTIVLYKVYQLSILKGAEGRNASEYDNFYFANQKSAKICSQLPIGSYLSNGSVNEMEVEEKKLMNIHKIYTSAIDFFQENLTYKEYEKYKHLLDT